ncbi:DUF4809 family protein [Candidatus Enterococcus mansonii]|uniref:DUF4809 domain-containing protein n=2 Tax=Candidatus Enterococcus mansonii TaxID=1834181 RepID=A0ABU8ICV5_9ENTE
MKAVKIAKKVNLLDGGCNACGIIEDVSYTLTYDEQAIPLDELNVNTLVTAIVLKNGFKREYESDVLDDYILYKKDNHQIRLKEEYDYLIYSTAQTKLETKDQIIDNKVLVKKVNEILTTIFVLDEVSFSFI